MCLIEDETPSYDRKYLADDITFAANYLGLRVRNIRFPGHREVTGCGTSIQVREGELFVVHLMTGLFQFYTADRPDRLINRVGYNPRASKPGVGSDSLFQLVRYMYGA
ncbi:MAG: hypothetical protein JWO15_3605 [Sphingomonadales bacterium]|nr:hypothetical protein [Sphingomonadales bacterium]